MYYELDVTDLVKEYVSGKYENTGLLIKAVVKAAIVLHFTVTMSGTQTE
jgi:hypothetical protein